MVQPAFPPAGVKEKPNGQVQQAAPAAPPQAGQVTTLVDHAGDFYEVPAGTELQAIAESGNRFRVATPDDYAAKADRDRMAAREARYGGAFGTAAAGLQGLGRGLLPFGMYDAALTGGAGLIEGPEGERRMRETLVGLKETNPMSSGVGEALGMIYNPVLGAAGGAARTGALGLARAGSLGRIATGALAGAAQGAAEVGLIEVGQQISDNILADHETTAEQLISKFGIGLFSGAATGGALGAAGAIGSRFLENAALKNAPKIGEKAREIAGQDVVKMRTPEAKRFGKNVRQLEERIQEGGEVLLNRPSLQDGDVLVSKELTKDVRQVAERLTKEKELVGKMVDDEVWKPLRQAKIAFNSDTILGRMEEAFESIAYKDRSGSWLPKPGLNSELADIVQFMKDTRRQLYTQGATAETFRDIQRNIRKKIKWHESNAADASRQHQPMEEIFRKMQHTLTEDVFQQGEAVLGGQWRTRADEVNKLFGILGDMEHTASRGAFREMTNKTIGLSELMSGHSLAGPGMAVGGLVGGIPGAIVGSVVGRGLGFVASRFYKDRGAIWAADYLNKFSKLRLIQEAANGQTKMIQDLANEFIRGGIRAGSLMTAAGMREKRDYKKAADRVQTMAANPMLVAEEAKKLIHPSVQAAAPQVTGALIERLNKNTQYLASKLPAGMPAYNRFATHSRPPSSADQAAFMRRLAVAENPMVVFEHMRTGTLTREHVEATREMYPKIFAQMQDAVVKSLMKPNTKTSRKQKQSLSLMFDISVDASQDPEFMGLIQATYDEAAAGEAEAAQATPPKRPMSGAGDNIETQTDRLVE